MSAYAAHSPNHPVTIILTLVLALLGTCAQYASAQTRASVSAIRSVSAAASAIVMRTAGMQTLGTWDRG
jgi:hypothetical protein